ncbi:5065_t:CDS:2, partial [Cetraspora pellucida]
MDKFVIKVTQKRTENNNFDDTLSDSDSDSSVQKTTPKKKKQRTDWDEAWVKLYPWLERKIVDKKILLFCRWCVAINAKNLFAKGSNSFHKYSLDRHIKIDEHKLAVLASIKNQPSVLQGFTKSLSERKLRIIGLMRNVYHISKNHLALDLFPHLCNLINLQLETQTELIYDQEPSTISLSNSSTLINNSRHNTYASYENPVSAKLFLEAISFVIEQSVIKETNLSLYWSIMIDENCSAASITANLKRFITAKALSLENLMHFGSDGASTMLGCKTGVAARLNNSYKKLRQLKMIQNYLDEPELAILNIVKTRWLSFSNVIHNFHQIVDSVMGALLEDANIEKKALDILSRMDDNFIIATKFLADFFYILEKLIRVFQSNYITFADIQQQINITIEAIQMQFIGIEDISPTFGKHLNDYLDQMQMTQDDLPLDVITFITDFGKAVIESLRKRFPDSNLYEAMRILDPKELPKQDRDLVNYGIKEITMLGEFYGVSKTKKNKVFDTILNKYELIQEWKQIFTQTSFKIDYPNITQLVAISLIIPVSNANVERIFSQQNLVKTHLRNQMSLETLNNHLMIIMNGSSIDSFDFERAYDYWAL